MERIDKKDIAGFLTAIGYIRVSDKEQGKDERFSLPHQREHIEEYCAQRRWRLGNIFMDVESGKGTARRKGLKAALRALDNADILIVHELDRLSRNLVDTLLIVNDVIGMKKLFVSIHDNIDSSSDDKWELQFHILAVFAHYFRRQLSRKVYETMMTKAQKGEWNSKPPYGYALENKHLIINENEAWIVRRIYELYLNQHYGIRAILIDLNRDTRAKRGGPWDYAEVRRILKNPAYTGDSVWNVRKRNGTKEEIRPEEDWVIVKNTHEPIIDREIYEETQERIKMRSNLKGRSSARIYPLSGVLRCGLCGGKMHGANKKSRYSKLRGRAKDNYRYLCTNYCKKASCIGVKANSIELENSVMEYIKNYLGPEDVAKALSDIKKYDPRVISDKKRKLDGMKKRLNAIPDKLDLQMQALENGRITGDEFDRARARVLTEKKDLLEEIKLLEDELKDISEDDIIRGNMADFYEVLQSEDPLVKRFWLQKHIDRITLLDNESFEIIFKGY